MTSSLAQDLNGKWLTTKDDETYITPKHLILEIENDSIKYYSFDQLLSVHPLKIDNGQIKIENGESQSFHFINPNRIKLETETENGSTALEFVRLLPTDTKLLKEEIESLSFDFNWNGKKFNIKFNQELKPNLAKNIEKKEVSKILLEEIDSTYFASFYQFGKRKDIFPIKEINADKMVLYGSPRKPYEIEGEKTE